MIERWLSLNLLLVLACSALLVRAADLQLVRGASYRALADQNRLRLVPEAAPRGVILDRRSRILASNQTVYQVAVVPQEAGDLPSLLAHVAAVVQQPLAALNKRYERERSLVFMPATIVPNVPKETAIRLEEERWKWPGLLVKAQPLRHYPAGDSAAHVLGYLSQPNADELPRLKPYGIKPKELVGRMGLEQALDHALRGQPGGWLVEVNHRARQVRTISRRQPQPGATVVLTLEAPLESLIEASFGAQPGAAVVLDPSSGAVLAMVSVPAFSPEAFAVGDSSLVTSYLNDAEAPLMNRAAAGAYQPGSIIKLVTAGAALEHRAITPETAVTCRGGMPIGDRVIHCWNRDGHGPMTLQEALMQSCNVYFMHAGRRAGLPNLRSALDAIGFSHKTGWLLEERSGHLPTRRLSEGELALLAIGQGEILVTPIQAAVMAAAFATDGRLVEPWVVSTIDGYPVPRRNKPRRLPWHKETFAAIRQGMRRVVADSQGTARRAFSPKVTIAGKTGTAQTHVPGQTHGWFVGFCPVDHPKAALAVVAEHGGSGGDLPAEIARAICEYVAVMDQGATQGGG